MPQGASQTLRTSPWLKQAQPTDVLGSLPFQALEEARRRKFWSDLLKSWGRWGLIGLGVGAGFSGLRDLGWVLTLPDQEEEVKSRHPVLGYEFYFPVASRRPQSEIKSLSKSKTARYIPQGQLEKWANDESLIRDTVRWLGEWLSYPFTYLGTSLQGHNLSRPEYHMLYPSGAALALLGGAYGGWKLTDTLADKVRLDFRKRELERAKSKYRRALLGEPGPRSKSSAISELVKLAEGPPTADDQLNRLFGIYLLLSLGAAAMTGSLSYSWAKARSEPQLLQQARKRQERKLWESHETPLRLKIEVNSSSDVPSQGTRLASQSVATPPVYKP